MPKQRLVVRAAARYLKDFPIARGRGFANRMLGRFLCVRVFDDVRLRLTNPLEYQQLLLLCDAQSYEPDVTRLLSATLQPGMVFFDVGANLGYYSLLGSKKVGKDGQVHSFEPAAAQFKHLKLNVSLNRAANVILNECALSDSRGETTLFLSEGWNQGTHSLARTNGQSSSCIVSRISVDEYVAMTGVKRLDVMKVDVEGAELLVFKGAQNTLLELKPSLLIFEASEPYAQSFGYSTSDLKQFVSRQGYTLFRLGESDEPVAVDTSEQESYANLVGIHHQAHESYYEALRETCFQMATLSGAIR